MYVLTTVNYTQYIIYRKWLNLALATSLIQTIHCHCKSLWILTTRVAMIHNENNRGLFLAYLFPPSMLSPSMIYINDTDIFNENVMFKVHTLILCKMHALGSTRYFEVFELILYLIYHASV